MSATLPKTVPSENGLRRLPGVVLFKAGEHTSIAGTRKNYTPEYVRALAETTEELRKSADFHFEPPAVLGHEIVQAKLAEVLSGDHVYKTLMADAKASSGGGPGRTDQLAAGWPENVRFDQGTGHLIGDLERIPPSVADLIDSGQLRYPSVEIKHDLKKPDGTRVDTLWRVALLGGTPPGCKAVPPLGQSHFAAAPAGVTFFADAGGNAPEDATPDKPVLTLLQKIFKFLTPSFLSSLNRTQVDQLAADAAASMDPDANGSQSTGTVADAAYAGLTAYGDTNMTDADRKAIVDALKAELVPDLKAALAPDLTASLTSAFADREKALTEKEAAIKAAADGAIKSFADREAQESRKGIDAFCDAELKSGRIRSWELDESNPKTAYMSVRQQMYRADPKAEVSCFADNGAEVKKTQLEIMMDAIRARPVSAFGDRLGGAKADVGMTPERRKKLLGHTDAGRLALASKN